MTAASCTTSRSWRPWRSRKIPLTAIVFNDNAYGNVKRIQQLQFQGHGSPPTSSPDMMKLIPTRSASRAVAPTRQRSYERCCVTSRVAPRPVLVECPVPADAADDVGPHPTFSIDGEGAQPQAMNLPGWSQRSPESRLSLATVLSFTLVILEEVTGESQARHVGRTGTSYETSSVVTNVGAGQLCRLETTFASRPATDGSSHEVAGFQPAESKLTAWLERLRRSSRH